MNTHPMHFDAEYAKASEFGRCIVCSPFTVALMVGMSVTDVSQKAIANLGWTDIKLTHPVFAGDTLYADSEVLDKRESKSRPGAGLVTVRTIGTNQDGTVVVHLQPHDADRQARPQRRRQGQLLRNASRSIRTPTTSRPSSTPSRSGSRRSCGRSRASSTRPTSTRTRSSSR